MFRQTFRLFAKMKDTTPAPKRLIICCDGTWQSSVSGKRNIPSNVTRLARTIAKAGLDDKGQQWQQLVYYDSGVGTGSLTWFEQARQGGTGDGLVVNVLEAYNFLVNNYEPGDQIFCFGFSRGAFTARAVAGLVTDIGVFKPQNMQNFVPLWSAYQKNTAKHEFRKTKEYFQFINGVRPMVPEGEENKIYILKPWEVAHTDEVNPINPLTWPNSHVVEVVGCFDTVGSLGLADTRLINRSATRKRYEYLNVKLSPFIKHAFHALALDDHREPFLPTLWYIPNEATFKEEEDAIDKEDDDWPDLKQHRDAVDKELREHQAKNPPDLYQVWFPGVHINIGGGSDEDSADAEGLSNVTFAWMVQQLGPYLAFEPWTWDEEGISGYQKRVIEEEALYSGMKKNMTREEERQFGDLFKKSLFEEAEDALSDWGHWIWENGKEIIGQSKKVRMVPVPRKNIRYPDPELIGKDGKPLIIRWGVSKVGDSFTTLYKLMNNPVNRAPGESHDRSREDGKPLKELGKTNEYIHPAVWWRYETMRNKHGKMEYESKALSDFNREKDPKYGSWGWRKGNVWIPEWFVKPTNQALRDAGHHESEYNEDDQPWQHAEWTYASSFPDSKKMTASLVEFFADARRAEKKMKAELKNFPFDVLS